MIGVRGSFLLLFLFTQTFTVFSKIAPGEWRTHFSYNNANQVVYADDKVYVEASNKLYSYSNAGVIETYSTLTGLNGHDVFLIAWCKAEKTLIVVYSDGNIDFLTKSGIINLSDFKNKSLTANKSLFSLRVEGKNAYLSTGVGLLVLDISKREISETYYLNFSSSYTTVYDAAVWGDTVAVATESGLYTGNTASNLQDVSYWSALPFYPGTKAVKIVRFNKRLFALAENGVVYQNAASGWSVFLNNPNASELLVQDGDLFICAGNQTYMYNSSMVLQNIPSIQSNSVAKDSIRDLLYIASGVSGLSKLSRIGSQYRISEDSIMGIGPASNIAWNGFFKDNVFYSTAGGRWGNRFFYPGNILVFKDEKWTDLANKEIIEKKTGLPLMDFMNMAIDPKDSGHYFITSYGEGLYEFRDNVFYKLWDKDNSPLVSAAPAAPDANRYIRVEGATFDRNDNLWVLNSYIDQPTVSPLHILKPDSTWFTPKYTNMPNSPGWNSILFTSRNQVWINALRYTYGIFVIEYGDKIEDTSDDNTRWISTFKDQDDNNLSPFTVNCVTEDQNGALWIGTVLGPIIANNPSNIFSSDFKFTRIKIPRNDGTENADYLLNEIRINCISVDGANRKWLGTNGNGLYLVSADGLKTVHHFNTENSPLPSDYIWSVTINPATGEVFIGTDAGLVSYRSDATQGAPSFSNVYVFPNPVKPEHSGNITVTGLMENTLVKITDMSGNILISGTSLGGQFSWNGYTKQGKRAASGVYLVLCASEDGMEYQACKFMIVN